MNVSRINEVWQGPLTSLAGVILLSVGLLLTQGAGAQGTLTVAVYPPWWGEVRTVAAVADTGGPIAEFGPFRWIVVTVPETASSAQALREGGAILLLNAAAARLCGA
jgi:hypothetical protein